MMTELRERSALVLWLVIFAFIGLIVVQWGAGFSSRKHSGHGTNVGVVNGVEIPLTTFQDALRNAARQRRDGQRTERSQLVQDVWQQFVRDIVLREAMEKMGIRVTDEEVARYTRTQPPPAVRQMEAFQTDGEFDVAKYSRFLSDPATISDPRNKAFVMQVEGMLRQQLLNYKLQRLLGESVHVTPTDVRDAYAEEHQQVEVEYIFVPSSTVAEDEIVITDADLAAYHEAHVDEFQHPEQVRLEYVYVPKVASAADSAAVAKEISLLKEELDAGADFAELAEVVSEDPGSADQGGDLGTFGRGRMVKAFEDVALALPVGAVSDPVRTQFGWHLIKVEERLEDAGEPKVHARHILLRFNPSRQTEEELEARVDSFRAQAEKESFSAAAAALDLEVHDSGFLARGSVIPELGEGTAWMVNTVFDEDPGFITRVGGNERGIWVARLAERRPEGVTPLAEVHDRVLGAVTREKKAAQAGVRLAAVRDKAITAGMQAVADELGLELRTPDAFSRAQSVPGIGRHNAFTEAAFQVEVGDVSQVVTMAGRGAFLIKVLERTPVDAQELEKARPQVRARLLAQRQQEVVRNWFAATFDAADIQDYRHQFGFTF